MNKRKIFGLIIGIIGISVMAYAVLGNADAHRNHNTCHSDCEVLPTVTITPTPIQDPCQIIVKDEEVGCITPTPTEPEATPSATPTPVSQDSTGATANNGGSDGLSSSPDATKPFVASCTVPFDAPLLQGFQRLSPTSVEFSFWGVRDVDKYSVVFGYSQDNLIYGIENVANDQTSFVLNDLQPNTNVWAQVWDWKNGCAEKSEIIDP